MELSFINRISQRLLMFVCCFLMFLSGNAQHVMGTSGSSHKMDNLSVSWTIGELATETLNGESITLTQGFHQPIFKVVGVEELVALPYKLEVFPNPANYYVNLQVGNPDLENFHYHLYDESGRLVSAEKINADITQIDFEALTPAVYFITIANSSTPLKTFKILKSR